MEEGRVRKEKKDQRDIDCFQVVADDDSDASDKMDVQVCVFVSIVSHHFQNSGLCMYFCASPVLCKRRFGGSATIVTLISLSLSLSLPPSLPPSLPYWYYILKISSASATAKCTTRATPSPIWPSRRRSWWTRVKRYTIFSYNLTITLLWPVIVVP